MEEKRNKIKTRVRNRWGVNDEDINQENEITIRILKWNHVVESRRNQNGK